MSKKDENERMAEEIVDSERFRDVFDYFDLALDSLGLDSEDDVEVYLPENTLHSFHSGSTENMRVMMKISPQELEKLDQGPWDEIDSMKKAYLPESSNMVIEVTEEGPESEDIEDRYENLDFSLYKENSWGDQRILQEYGEDLKDILDDLPSRDELDESGGRRITMAERLSRRDTPVSKRTTNTNKLLGRVSRYPSRISDRTKTDATELEKLQRNVNTFYDEEVEEELQLWMEEELVYDDKGQGIGIHQPTEIKTHEIAEAFENRVESAEEDNEIAVFVHNLVRALGNLAEEDLKEGDEYVIGPAKNSDNDIEDFIDLDDLASSFHGKLAYNVSITDQDTILAYDLGFASALVAEETSYNPKDYHL